MIHVVKGRAKLKLALTIPSGDPIILEKEIIYIPPFAADGSNVFYCFLFFL